MIYLKSTHELEKLMEAGKRVAYVLREAVEKLRAGISTKQIDKFIERLIYQLNAVPYFLGYNGYPAASCISLNHEVIHGIPSDEKIIKEGDIVKIDVGIFYDGYYVDAAVSVGIGNLSPEVKSLLNCAKKALYKAIEVARPPYRIGDIGWAIESCAKEMGFDVVDTFAGHGIGILPHEDPDVPNRGKKGKDLRLREGMVLCIEPMITLKSGEVEILPDGWTVVTKDRSLSAHFEHTIFITKNQPIILTPWDNKL